MFKRLLVILFLSCLIGTFLIGCAGQIPSPSSPSPSPSPSLPSLPPPSSPSPSLPPSPTELTMLSITDGDVFVMKSGTENWIEAQVGMSLEPGDIIKTGDDSNATITFFEGSTIELQAGTQIEVASLDLAATGSTTIMLTQEVGKTISRVTKLTDAASRYEVETPAGVAAVRGSIMLVEVGANGTTWITNQQGDIWAIAQGIEVQIPEGMTCIVVPGLSPQLLIYTGGDSGGGGGGGGYALTDLGMSKCDSADPVYAGANLTYTLQVGNNGPSDSTGAIVLDILPAGVSFVSATDGGTYHSGSHTVIWPIGALASGASTSVNVTVTVNASTLGTISNIAVADANEDDNNPANDAASENTTVNSLTDLGISKCDSADPVYAGANLTYTLQISNNGPSDSTGASVLDTLPAGVSFVSATDGGTYDSGSHTVTWTIGALAKGASTSVNVTVTVNGSTLGTISNIAIADANEDDNNPANDTASEDTLVNRAFATINVQSDSIIPSTNTTISASIYIWDDNDGGWARDEDTGDPVDGTHHTTPSSISVAAGHYYYVWIQTSGYIFKVKSYPEGWSIVSAPEGGGEAAYGYAGEEGVYSVHFVVM